MPQQPDMLLYQQGPSNSSTTGTRTASTMNGHNKIIQIEGTKIDKRSNHSNPPTTASVQRRRSSTSSITTSPIVKRTKRKRSSSTKAADVDPANTKSNKYSFQSKSSFLVVRRTTNPPSQPCYSKKLQQKGPKREYSNAKCVRRIEKENFPIPPQTKIYQLEKCRLQPEIHCQMIIINQSVTCTRTSVPKKKFFDRLLNVFISYLLLKNLMSAYTLSPSEIVMKIQY